MKNLFLLGGTLPVKAITQILEEKDTVVLMLEYQQLSLPEDFKYLYTTCLKLTIPVYIHINCSYTDKSAVLPNEIQQIPIIHIKKLVELCTTHNRTISILK